MHGIRTGVRSTGFRSSIGQQVDVHNRCGLGCASSCDTAKGLGAAELRCWLDRGVRTGVSPRCAERCTYFLKYAATSLTPTPLTTGTTHRRGHGSTSRHRPRLTTPVRLVLEHHPHRPLPDFRVVLACSVHRSILSRIGASGNLRALHSLEPETSSLMQQMRWGVIVRCRSPLRKGSMFHADSHPGCMHRQVSGSRPRNRK